MIDVDWSTGNIRQQLLPVLPLLSYHFGLHPPTIDDLTGYEVEAYLQALDNIKQEQRRQQAEG